jgi:hypothetical protein
VKNRVVLLFGELAAKACKLVLELEAWLVEIDMERHMRFTRQKYRAVRGVVLVEMQAMLQAMQQAGSR